MADEYETNDKVISDEQKGTLDFGELMVWF
jgi:hypothetical protein